MTDGDDAVYYEGKWLMRFIEAISKILISICNIKFAKIYRISEDCLRAYARVPQDILLILTNFQLTNYF